ncbi:MAG: CBS domain-containing protein [Candidatus Altiarchaeota archaeon]|nr:CBS domain-containing protein [Candidatus Altiarchaeota archaeon]
MVRIKKVKGIMSGKVISVKANDSVLEAIKVLRDNRVSGVPVVDEKNNLCGVMSGTDILKLVGHLIDYHPFLIPFFRILEDRPEDLRDIVKEASRREVREIMSEPAITIEENASVYSAATLMFKRDINRLPVVDKKGSLVGVITRKDLLQAFKDIGGSDTKLGKWAGD